MNITQFRTDLSAAIEASEKSVFAFAQEAGVQQASLHRFLNGKTGLNAETLFSLWPFVYGDLRPIPKIPSPETPPEAPR